jgi:polysaccharide export outer membrane protein
MTQGKASKNISKYNTLAFISIIILLWASCASVKRVHLINLDTKESPTETELILTTTHPVQFNNTKLDNPPCVIISFPGNKVYSTEKDEIIINKGPIKRIKNEYLKNGNKGQRQLQFVLVELTQDTAYQILDDGSSIRIRLKNPQASPDLSSQEMTHIDPQSQREKKESLVEPGYLIGPEDVLNIEVWNQPDITREVTVNNQGEITVPPVRKLSVIGLTVSQLEEKLSKALSKYLIDPIVFVSIKEFNSQRVTVLGETKTGMYTLKRRTTLVEFLGQIGGTTENADTYHIKLIKKDRNVFAFNLNELINNPQKSESIIVSGGDTVYVPPLEFNKVYVLGEVKNPRIVTIKGKLTLIDAITEAGGFTRDAVRKSVMVVRGELGSQKGIRVNAKQMLKEGDISQNIELEAGDIIFVPKTFVVSIERFLRLFAYPLTWYFWFLQ